MMRARFNEELERLNTELIAMGALCEDAIACAAKALLDGNAPLREKVAGYEEEINRKEREIEALCLKLLLHQQPVARDLRQISAAMKMIGDMERIGDQAEDIAELTTYIQGQSLHISTHIGDMARAAIKMVTDSVDSFVCCNLEKARAVIDSDDIVDDLFVEVKADLIRSIRTNPGGGGLSLDLLMIAKYLERIGDHAVNIAERVVFCITGEL